MSPCFPGVIFHSKRIFISWSCNVWGTLTGVHVASWNSVCLYIYLYSYIVHCAFAFFYFCSNQMHLYVHIFSFVDLLKKFLHSLSQLLSLWMLLKVVQKVSLTFIWFKIFFFFNFLFLTNQLNFHSKCLKAKFNQINVFLFTQR